MSLLIKNNSVTNVILNDLGLELIPSEIYDLARDEASDVRTSAQAGGDLFVNVTGATPPIQVLDPLDDVTVLDHVAGASSPAIVCLRSHNDPHYRIRGGELNQLDDVTLAGSPPIPLTNDLLQYNGSTWSNVPASTFGTDVDRIQHIHVGKHGSDSNDGLTPNKAKLTFTSAITAATPSGSPELRYSIVCEDAGSYAESFTVPSYVSIEAVDATINGTITISDNSEITVREVFATPNTSAVIKTSGSESSRVNAEVLRSTGTGDTVTTQSGETGVLLVYSRQVFTENGSGILDNSTSPSGHIHIEIEDIYITGTGSALDRNSSTGLILGRVAHILEIGGGIGNGTAIDISSGMVQIIAGFIETTTAYNVSGSGTLRMLVTNLDGLRIQTAGSAIVDVIEAQVLRWVPVTSADSPYTPRRIGFYGVDTTGGAVSVLLPTPPSDGDNVSFQDSRNNFSINNLTIDAQAGNLIDDGGAGTQTVVLTVDGTSGIFIYNASISRWTFSRIQEEVGASPDNAIYVTKNGDDTLGDGSFSNPFLTIKRGVQEALSRVAVTPVPTTVKVLDGIFDEINPIDISGTNSHLVQVQGQQEFAVIVRPTVDNQPLFTLESAMAGLTGPSLNRMTIDGNSLPAFRTNNQAAIVMSGPGRYVTDKVNILNCGIGIDSGNSTGSPDNSSTQEAVFDFATISDCNTAVDAKGSGIQALQVSFFRGNDVGLNASGNVRVEAGNYAFQGALVGGSPNTLGTGIVMNDNAVLVATSGTITNLDLGTQVNDSSTSTLLTTSFGNNTIDFDQADTTASLTIQGTISRTKQLIADGAIVSLNYIDTDTGDYIVGNADATGDPGLQFRVRDADGRVFIGDNAENYNAPTNTVGGSRTVNLIDTNGNLRIWRWESVPGLHPAFEWLKGVNTFAADDEGDAPITGIAAGSDTITIDLSGADYNDPLDPGFPGADRTTLDTRVFYTGAEIRVNGTSFNDGDYVVSSSTYNPGPETIDVVVTTDITISEGAVGTCVFGGGAGRPDGVSTYVDDPTNAIANGVGDVHWDMLLRETDSFVVRRRTGGAGKEHFRFFRDRTEILHGPAYSGSDNNLVAVFEGVAGTTGLNVEYLTFRNTAGGAAEGPEIEAVGGGTNIDIQMIPKGTGTVTVPPGYEANIVDDSLITKAYFDGQAANPGVVQARRTTTLAVPVTPTWGDVTFDTTDVETDATIVEHNNTNTQVIDIKVDGLYALQYVLNTDDEALSRIVDDGVGGTSVVAGSLIQVGDVGDVNDVIVQNSPVVYAELTAGDELVVQIQATTTAEVIQVGSLFTVQKVTGVKGDKGDPGAGTTITVEEDDMLVSSDVGTLNFEGNCLTVTGEGGSPVDKATITVNCDILSRHNGATTQTLTPTAVTMLFGSNVRTDANYTYSAGEVTITNAGWYRFTFDISAEGTTGTRSSGEFFLENNTVLVPGTYAYTYNRTTTPGEQTASCSIIVQAAASDVFRVRGHEFAGNNIVTMADACRFTIESLGT